MSVVICDHNIPEVSYASRRERGSTVKSAVLEKLNLPINIKDESKVEASLKAAKNSSQGHS
ncbi:MAG: hypothetical protein QXL85_08250 [Candidatus Bathyarchaeia archaeon]